MTPESAMTAAAWLVGGMGTAIAASLAMYKREIREVLAPVQAELMALTERVNDLEKKQVEAFGHVSEADAHLENEQVGKAHESVKRAKRVLGPGK